MLAHTHLVLTASTFFCFLASAAAQIYELPPIPTIMPGYSIPSISVPLGATPTSKPDGVLTSSLPGGGLCASSIVKVSVVTSLLVKTVVYTTSSVTTIPAYQSITVASCIVAPTPSLSSTCVTGSPVTIGGYTIAGSPVTPTPYIANYVPSPAFETGTGNHLIAYQDYVFGKEFQAYAENKCQFACQAGCDSWYIGYNTKIGVWRCIQFNAIIPPSVLVAPSADAPYVSGTAFNALCGPKPSLTEPGPIPTSSADGVLTTSKPSTSSKPIVIVVPTYPGTLIPTSIGGGLTTLKPTIPLIPSLPVVDPPIFSSSLPVPTSLPGGELTSKPLISVPTSFILPLPTTLITKPTLPVTYELPTIPTLPPAVSTKDPLITSKADGGITVPGVYIPTLPPAVSTKLPTPTSKPGGGVTVPGGYVLPTVPTLPPLPTTTKGGGSGKPTPSPPAYAPTLAPWPFGGSWPFGNRRRA